MTYQVLARKWRPRTFAELVGQDHVVRVLANALDNDRVHHAYLFTGTRGVGKTTVARILAKALNCERGVSSKPCGECGSCHEIDEGRFVDLIEVDAASRTGVDDTRELLDNVQYTPVRGRYKVYLIDEVHMFSRSSFNALLKTLEEPPPHVKFLLATTDPRKLPVTVLSRCLQFNLRSLPVALIADYLVKVLDREAVEHESGAVRQLARAAEGSMRDALSLLDQAIAFGGGRLGVDDVADMLGTIDQHHVLILLQALADADARQLLDAVAKMDTLAPDYGQLLADLLHDLQRIAVLQAVPEAATDDDDAVGALAAALAPEDVQLYYQIALIGRRDLPLAPDPRAGFEMLVLRMLAFQPQDSGPGGGEKSVRVSGHARSALESSTKASDSKPEQPLSSVATQIENSSGARSTQLRPGGLARQALSAAMAPEATSNVVPLRKPRPGEPDAVIASRVISELSSVGAPMEVPLVEPGAEAGQFDAGAWDALLPSLSLDGMTAQLASHCLLESVDDGVAQLALEATQEHLCSSAAEGRLAEALSKRFGNALRIRFRVMTLGEQTPAARRALQQAARQGEAEEAIARDPNVELLKERFGATICPGSIKPLDG